MRRFYIKEIIEKDNFCVISGSEARHMTKVLRMGKGDRFVLMDGEGKRYQALIKSIESTQIHMVLEKDLPVPPASPIEIILCQSILKSNSMDYMIQKTSELGVNRIIPFSSTRTIVRLKGDRAENRLRHWRRIAQGAAKQADRVIPAFVDSPIGFSEMVEGIKEIDAMKIIMWEEETSRDLKILIQNKPSPQTVICVVGPEGGFSREEIASAKEAGIISTSLGSRILRAETAAITISAIIQYEWGDLCMSI